MSVDVHHGDSRAVLKDMPDESVDAVVTDPPYALVSIQKRFGKPGSAAAKAGRDGLYQRASKGFMGKQWDTGETAFDPAFWAEVLRVLKPGGHVVAFGGTRTYHRLACAIEDAGFEIRDMIGWLYGSGFPKSHDVSKGIDRHNGDRRPVVGREVLSNDIRGGALLDCAHDGLRPGFERDITSAASAASAAWEGWGTALKPAQEPIVLARKPLAGTVAQNVLTHGTGSLNIDGCRVGTGEGGDRTGEASAAKRYTAIGSVNFAALPGLRGGDAKGRWPANVVHDGSSEVLSAFPDAVGQQGAVRPDSGNGQKTKNILGQFKVNSNCDPRGDTGSAARFFYSPKATKADRLASKHPTVKPVDLMAWLCRLVTPPGGLVLDPFAGSGTTGMACIREGFDAILIERDAEYVADIKARLAHISGADCPLFQPIEAAE